MLAGACRTTRSRFRDVEFVDELELPRRMGGEHTRETRSEPRSDHDVNLTFTSVMIKGQKRTNIGEVIGRADDVDPPPNELFGEMGLRPSRTGEHHHVDIERRINRTTIDRGAITKTPGDEFHSVPTLVAQHDLVVIGGHELPSETGAHRTHPENSDASHLSRDQDRRVRAIHPSGEERLPSRGAERQRRRALPCRWQPWPVGSSSSWG